MQSIKKGSRGNDVKRLQEFLGLQNCDGIFGAATEAALVAFQSTHFDAKGKKLVPDGICGPSTWAALLEEQQKKGNTPLTIDKLGTIMPNAMKSGRAAQYIDSLNAVMAKYHINTPLRMAHFLAQIAHESGELRYTEEIASGSAYDTGAKASSLGNTPQKDGDGQRYKGRGLIQLTGRANYTAFAKDTGCDCINHPELLAKLPWSVETAGWFWKSRDLNAAADADAFITITKRINGGTNGLDSRRAYLTRAKKAFGI